MYDFFYQFILFCRFCFHRFCFMCITELFTLCTLYFVRDDMNEDVQSVLWTGAILHTWSGYLYKYQYGVAGYVISYLFNTLRLIGNAPISSEWSTNLLPNKVRLILEVCWYSLPFSPILYDIVIFEKYTSRISHSNWVKLIIQGKQISLHAFFHLASTYLNNPNLMPLDNCCMINHCHYNRLVVIWTCYSNNQYLCCQMWLVLK